MTDDQFDAMVRRGLRLTWDASNGVIAASCTEEVIAAAEASGCIALIIGMESGHPTILRRSMRDLLSGHATVVEMSGVDYDLGIDDDVFTERYLRRPPARWIAE